MGDAIDRGGIRTAPRDEGEAFGVAPRLDHLAEEIASDGEAREGVSRQVHSRVGIPGIECEARPPQICDFPGSRIGVNDEEAAVPASFAARRVVNGCGNDADHVAKFMQGRIAAALAEEQTGMPPALVMAEAS